MVAQSHCLLVDLGQVDTGIFWQPLIHINIIAYPLTSPQLLGKRLQWSISSKCHPYGKEVGRSEHQVFMLFISKLQATAIKYGRVSAKRKYFDVDSTPSKGYV